MDALDRTIRLIRDLISNEIPDEAVVKEFQQYRIRCLSNETNLLTHAGQTALITFVSLVARMGVQIDLDIPELRLVRPQPPLRGVWLREGLLDFGLNLIPESTITNSPLRQPDLVFVFGDSAYTAAGVCSWRVCGSAWEGSLKASAMPGLRWEGDWPIGAMTAAVLAATEVFKSVLRRLPLRNNYQANYLQPIEEVTWDFGAGCPVPSLVNFESLDIISGGAIAQSVLFLLLRLPHLKTAIRVFDDDLIESSNLNRSMMTRRPDIGNYKVNVLASYSSDSVQISGIPERFEANSMDKYLPLAPYVLVGVDGVKPRWTVQVATKDGWLAIGATTHFDTVTSSHTAGEPCGGCLHPVLDSQVVDPIPTVSFVSFWAGLALVVRLIRRLIGYPYTNQQQVLWLTPLRMDSKNAARFEQIKARSDCPIGCVAQMYPHLISGQFVEHW